MDFILTVAVDFIFLIVLAISILSAMHKGFFKSMLSLVALVLSLVVAGLANGPAAEWCYDSFISDSIIETVEDKIPEEIDNIEIDDDIKSFVDSLPTFVSEQLDKLNIDVDESLEKISNKNLSSDEIAEEISNELIRPGVVMLLRLICFVILFLIARLVFGIVAKIISKFADLPILKQFNKALGALLGLFKGLFCVFSLAIVLNFISQLIDSSSEIVLAIENSVICDIIGEIVK